MITISQFFLTFLLNAVWQIALVTVVAAICARLLRGMPARYGYWLWVTALSLSLLLPVLTSSQFLFDNFFNPQPVPEISTENPAVRLVNLSPVNSSFPLESNTKVTTLTLALGTNLAISLFAAYILFVLYRTVKLFRAWLRTRRIARTAYQASLPDHILTVIERCKSVIGFEQVAVLCSESVSVPVTIGNRHPLIILPKQFLEETDTDLLMTAIGHELVHVRRRDYVFNLIFEFVCLPLSFHPAVIFLKRRIGQMRELCCDEIVTERLLKAEVYARSLITIAGSVSNLNRLAPTTVGITGAENLEERIMSLLKKSESSSYRKSLLIIGAILLLAVPCVVAAIFVTSIGISDVSAQQTEKETLSKEERERRQVLEKIEKEKEQLRYKITDDEKLRKEKELLEKKIVEDKSYKKELEERLTQAEQIKSDRLEQIKLAQEAKITMGQAIQNATNFQAGTVLSSNFGRFENEVIYRIMILDKDSKDGNVTMVLISGIDGRVVKTEKGMMK